MNERPKRRLPVVPVIAILLLLVTTLSLLLYIRDMRREPEPPAEPVYTDEDALEVSRLFEGRSLPDGDSFYRRSTLQDMAEEAYSLTELMSMLYPDKIVYYNDENMVYLPVSDQLKKSGTDLTGLSKDDRGRMDLTLPDGTKALTGIDVSSWQGYVDWKKVKADGIDFAILRAGLRGYGSAGKLSLDNEIARNLEGTRAAGIPVGIYFYTMAVNEAEAEEEAQLVLDAIKGYDITWPVIIDVELPSAVGRTDGLTPGQRTDVVITFCEKVKAAGYTPMIYANMRTFNERLELDRLEDYEKWFAQYFSRPYYPYDFGIWQYTSSGEVDGVSGTADLNIAFRDYGKG